MSAESRLVSEPLEVDLPMKTSSGAGQDTDEWLRVRDGCLSVYQVVARCKLAMYSFIVLLAARLPLHVPVRLFVISTVMQ